MVLSTEKILDIVKEWSTHLAVALSIILVWELWSRSQNHNRNENFAALSNPRTEVNKTERNQHRKSRILDQLEEKQQRQRQEKVAVSVEEQSEIRTTQKQPKSTTQKRRNEPSRQTKPTQEAPASSIVKSDEPPPIKATSNDHPGMEAFNYWHETECSLFRIYTLGRRDNVQVVPPYVPHSYRGTVPIHLNVKNSTDIPMKIFWVNFQGKSIFKGDLKPHHFWTQTTWIDHPWVFEHAETQEPLLYYIPYRVIPTTTHINTISEDGTGQHKFSLVTPKDSTGPFWIGIKDEVMPFPAEMNFANMLSAVTWTLQQISRLMSPDDPSIDTLQKYLSNIMENPCKTKYRQIRIRSPKFSPIWQSTLKGLLLAVGFVEREGYAELGCAEELSRERVQEIALVSYLVNKWKKEEGQTTIHEQPEGADGFGRQGYGRAGTIN